MVVADFISILRRQWIVIIVITLLVVLAAFVFSWMQPSVYEARASCVVSSTASSENEYQAVQVITTLLKTINEIAVSKPVLEETATRLKTRVSTEELKKDITSEVITYTQIIAIHARDETPVEAKDKANAVAESLINYMNKSKGESSNYKIELLEIATRPQTPISPKPVRNCIIALFLGLILGTIAAYLLDLRRPY